jgi:hypothetical protein
MSPGSSKKVGITVATIFSPFSKKNLLVCDSVTISHFGSFEPDVGRGASQGSLKDTKETTVALANLKYIFSIHKHKLNTEQNCYS